MMNQTVAAGDQEKDQFAEGKQFANCKSVM
jgi:hypothetical protein